jgi:PEP-CTERM motif-containing protein
MPGARVLCSALLLSGAAAPLFAAVPACGPRDTPTLIFPGDSRWAVDKNVYPVESNLATIAITPANPRSGNGSLELATTGSLFDWAFFKRVADGDAAWGLLSAVNCLSFDWWRNSYTLPNPAPPDLTAETWQEQTPVLRLLVRDTKDNQTVLSHLVWERWYNTRNSLVPTENDQWHFENLTGQQLWRHFDGGLTYTNAGCVNTGFDGSAALQTFDIGGWVQNCYSASAEVYGIMIGVGSMWPGSYHAFLDNVQLSFGGQQGFVVEDNFELPSSPIPEPATLLLVATGLAALIGARYLRRRVTS